MDLKFETDYNTILAKLDKIDPVKYSRSRNYIDGAVTCLSPYISRGVISTKQVLEVVLKKGYKIHQIEKFVNELCWRDYFQRVGQVKDLHENIKQAQTDVSNHEIPARVLDAATGIEGIDSSITQLYQSGYMHNHCRMYLAMLVCNIAKSHWYNPSQWLYYHLLDGDLASNVCSWQWVAGANSSKRYFANQENINKYTYTNQANTYLDNSYEALEKLPTPPSLLGTQMFNGNLELPEPCDISVNTTLPTFIYNYYNLDPLWHKDEPGNRVLLIEPDFFAKYPVSEKCINFMQELSNNIPGIQSYTGSFKSFVDKYEVKSIYFKEHPLNAGYRGIEDDRDWITKEVSGYYPSFFSFWKKVEKKLHHYNP